MKIDKILWVALLINLCVAVIARWPMLCKVLVIVNGIAVLGCVIRVFLKGGDGNG